MKCHNCNADLTPGARFCGVCGVSLLGPTIAPGQMTAPAAAAPSASPASAPASAPQAQPAPYQTPAPVPGDPYIGKTLNNRFKVESKLGEGGFGAVYKGTQLGIGREVALKLLHPEMTRDQNLVARFRREGKVACQLGDAHTITTYDFDQTPDGTLYIAMELLSGKSLHDVFQSEAPISWQRMFKIVTEMCTSLHEAHQRGIVHRDLKPENIHLESRPGNPEFVKVLDFGIAKVIHGDGAAGSGSPQLTATGQTLGTLEYMSPEQLMGKQLDGRSDVYAIGVLAYELITGHLPFPDAKGPAMLISAQLRTSPEPLSKTISTVPPVVDDIVLRCLGKEPKDRFEDVMALRIAAEEALSSGGQSASSSMKAASAIPANVVATTIGKGKAGPTPANPPAPAAPKPAPAGRGEATEVTPAATAGGASPWMWIALAIVAVGLGVGALFALT